MATTVTLKPNAIDISGSTSGTTTLQATAVAGTTTLTLPAATDTLVGKDTTDTLTNKTLTGAVMNGTLGATTPSTVSATSISYSTTLTGGTGIVNLGSGQFYKDASGNVGIGTSSPTNKFDVSGTVDGVLVAQVRNLSAGTSARACVLLGQDTNAGAAGMWVNSSLNTNFGGANSLNIYHGLSAPIVFFTAASERMRIDSSGNVLVGVTSANANGGVLQLKSGITFPATQVAATDANTLDDYEEGTWTPTIFGATTAGTTTYTSQVGSYTKIGRKVFCNLECTWSAQTGTGSLKIGGLPFNCSAAMPTAAFIIFNGTVAPANASGAVVKTGLTTILCYVFVAGVSGATYAQFSYDV